MSDNTPALVPAFPDNPSREGVFSHFEPGTRTLPAGFQVKPCFMPLPVDIVLDKDVAVTLRDGVTIYVDVLRPTGGEKAPAIVAWSPYGKSRGNAAQYLELYQMLGMDTGKLSGLQKFEGPDPAFWCANGYAVCNPDPRGSYNSEGDLRWWTREEGEDYHDLIEWLSAQNWCTGKIGTTGNSYLCISQWFVAAEQPSHLAAIAPWEGMSDIYRDLVVPGGIPDFGFSKSLATAFVGKNMREDLIADAEAHSLMDALWKQRIPEFENIIVPAYVTASYSNTVHTMGTFRAWRRIGSADKWLRIHNTMEWPDYYQEENVQDLLLFFDHYLKGIDNRWRETPRVRYSILDLEGGDRVNIAASHFPPEDVSEVRYYLDGTSDTLSAEAPDVPAKVAYDSQSEQGCATFTVRVDSPMVFVGYPKVRLWVEADGADDLDLFVFIQKLNPAGGVLEQFNIPNHGPQVEKVTRNGAAILKYKGSNGRLRVSMRHLDEMLSSDSIPVHSFDRVEKLAPGEIAEVEIDMFPIGLMFYPGEQLRLIATGHNLLGGAMPGIENVPNCNQGRHVIHTGSHYSSYLQLSVLLLHDRAT